MINQDEKRLADRWRQFWAKENKDTPLLSVTALKNGVKTESVCKLSDDPAEYIKSARRKMEATYYGGDAFPYLAPDLSPELTLAVCGIPFESSSYGYRLTEHAEEMESLPTLVFDLKNEWWQKLRTLSEAICKDAKGDYLIGLPDLYSGNDLLAALMRPEHLCVDLLDCPEQVTKRIDELITVNEEIFSHVFKIISTTQQGLAHWTGIFNPEDGPASSGSDFSCLAGTEEFNELLLPGISRELSQSGKNIYHLDGIYSLRHLDTILCLDHLTAIQWVPGEAKAVEWIEACRKIQSTGKLLQIDCHAEDMKTICEALKPEGLHLKLTAADEDEAKAILKQAEEIYKAKR